MKSFLVQCIHQDGDRCEWPRFIVLGDRSSILADRMIEYAESISLTGWKSDPCAIETRPFDPVTWLDCQENELHPEEVFVVISGPPDAEDESLLERAVAKIGARCFIVIDAKTRIRPDWQSVVRLPPHRSWDAQWAWGIRVFLDVLLEAAAHRGLICSDPMDILTCINGRLCELAVFHAEGEGRAVTAVNKAMHSCIRDVVTFRRFSLGGPHTEADILDSGGARLTPLDDLTPRRPVAPHSLPLLLGHLDGDEASGASVGGEFLKFVF